MAHLSTNSCGLLLSHVLPHGRWFGCERERDEIRFSSCCFEADRCEPGDLFVVLEESPVNAQEAVDRALQRGAGAILSERVFPRPVRQFLVDDCRLAYGQLCHALLGTPAQSLRTLAVTGTFGKTVTRHLLASVLQAAGHRVGAMSSRRTASGEGGKQSAGSARLARMLADFRGRGGTHAVIDAARQSVARHHLSGLEFDAAVVTGLSGAPTTSGGPIGRSFAYGKQLLDQLKPGGFAVLNADDLSSKALLDQLDVPVLTVGLQRPADLTATLLERHPSEQTFLLETGDESHVVRTAMIGDDHLLYCLAAAAVGLVMGVSPNQIVQGLEAVQTVPGRLQRVECGQPFSVYIDRSTNPSALARNLTTLRAVCSGRLHCLAGVDLRVPPIRRAQMGRVLERLADRSVLTGTRLNRKLPLPAAHDALDGFDRPAQAHLMPNRSRAVCWTLSQASPGDVVLLAGGRESLGPDNVRLNDEDVTRYWLQHVDQQASCPWTPA